MVKYEILLSIKILLIFGSQTVLSASTTCSVIPQSGVNSTLRVNINYNGTSHNQTYIYLYEPLNFYVDSLCSYLTPPVSGWLESYCYHSTTSSSTRFSFTYSLYGLSSTAIYISKVTFPIISTTYTNKVRAIIYYGTTSTSVYCSSFSSPSYISLSGNYI